MMKDRKQLARQLEQAEANAVQADKDGRTDAAIQWRILAVEFSNELVIIEKARLSSLLAKSRKS